MAIASYVLCLLALGSELVSGLAFELPRETKLAGEDGLGWTPVPTDAPRYPTELMRRGVLMGRQYYASTILTGTDATCGYLSGRAGAPYTCGPGGICNFFPAAAATALGAVACAYNNVYNARLECINSADYYSSTGACDDVCQANTFTLKCIYATAPYCNTAVWADVSVRDVYCAGSSVSRTQIFYTTYSGQTIGGSFTSFAIDLETSSTTRSSSTTRVSSSTTSSSTTSTTTIFLSPTPIPSQKSSTPVGAIVGGVVGGGAVLALIVFGIFFMRRRNRNAAAAGGASGQTNTFDQPPPPVYIPAGAGAEMDGSGVGKPPPVSEYGGYFAPAPGHDHNKEVNTYQGGNVSVGGMSVDGNSRRESNISPVSPRTQHTTGATVGSPHMSGRESYVSGTGYETYPNYPPPAAHEMPGSSVPGHR